MLYLYYILNKNCSVHDRLFQYSGQKTWLLASGLHTSNQLKIIEITTMQRFNYERREAGKGVKISEVRFRREHRRNVEEQRDNGKLDF